MAPKAASSPAVTDETHKAGVVVPSPPPTPTGTVLIRRKAVTETRMWLVVSESGASYLQEVGKHAIMRRTGLPERDLRVLDPVLAYPSTILGREKAIVVKLENIKAIIKATEALILNPRDRTVENFVQELQHRVSSFYPGGSQQAVKGSDTENGAMTSPTSPSSPSGKNVPQNIAENANESEIQEVPEASKAIGPKPLPFEFRVLELCLEYACKSLENETVALEKEAYPALDELTSKISTLNLERVRQIKSRLVAISGRVQKVRDELEHLLDDDMDMAEMYLTNKLINEGFEDTSLKCEDDDNEHESDDERYENYRSKHKSISGSVTNIKPNIQELEMLLEAYFIQIEGTLNKLSTMREYVDDTEDYINIMLDDKQNQLLQMGVMLSTATLVISAAIVVVGVLGMNIHISLFNSDVNPIKFWEATGALVSGALILYFIAFMWGKRQGLLA